MGIISVECRKVQNQITKISYVFLLCSHMILHRHNQTKLTKWEITNKYA